MLYHCCRLLYTSLLWPCSHPSLPLSQSTYNVNFLSFFLSFLLIIIMLILPCRSDKDVTHSRVWWDGKQFCFGRNKFPDVETLMDHFDQQPLLRLIVGDTGEHRYEAMVICQTGYSKTMQSLGYSLIHDTAALYNPYHVYNTPCMYRYILTTDTHLMSYASLTFSLRCDITALSSSHSWDLYTSAL